MEPLSNVHITCTSGTFASGAITVDGVPMYGVTKVEWSLGGDDAGGLISRAIITVEGATVDAFAEAEVRRAG